MTRMEIVEVAPRDGLQNEAVLVSTEAKIELIQRAIAAGARRIEATSFVNPKRVPQMADADAVMAAFANRPADVKLSGLALNLKGFERARDAGCDEINFVVVASETFSRRNQGTSIAETLAVWREVSAAARAAGRLASVTIGAAFGCPFEGEVAVEALRAIVAEVAADQPFEIALADTIGVASPFDVATRVAVAAAAAPEITLRCHFHNTRNTGIANAYAAVLGGVTVLDASLGGIGGCPFAPAATGNIPTEDLVYMLDRMGIQTGLDLDRLIESATWLGGQLGRPVPGMVCKAGRFPAAAPGSLQAAS